MGMSIQIRIKSPTANRSVYVIGFDWFLRANPTDQHHKNQLVLYRPGFAAEAAGQKPALRPRSRGALPSGVTVFANAKINKTTS